MSKRKTKFKTKELPWKKIEVLVRNKDSAEEAGRRNLKCHNCHKQRNDRYECIPCGTYLVFTTENINLN